MSFLAEHGSTPVRKNYELPLQQYKANLHKALAAGRHRPHLNLKRKNTARPIPSIGCLLSPHQRGVGAEKYVTRRATKPPQPIPRKKAAAPSQHTTSPPSGVSQENIRGCCEHQRPRTSLHSSKDCQERLTAPPGRNLSGPRADLSMTPSTSSCSVQCATA